MKRKGFQTLSLLLALALLAAFLPGPVYGSGGEAAPVLSLDKTTVEIAMGNAAPLTATLTDPTKTITWTSSDTAIATVAQDGTDSKNATVTAVAKGTATITATAGTETATCTVTVVEKKEITKLDLDHASYILDAGEQKTLTAFPSPADTTSKLEWTSSDPDVATVSSTGGAKTATITGKGAGMCTITARAQDGNGQTASCSVEVSGVTLSETAVTLAPNSNVALQPTFFGDAKTLLSANWEWNSSDSTVARVNITSGTITGVREGEATITCAQLGYSASCVVTVERPASSTVRASLSNGKLSFGSIERDLRYPEDASGKPTGQTYQYITGVTVSAAQGTLYDGYVSEAVPGRGVAATDRFYFSGDAYLVSNITFIPKPTYSGEAVIRCTGWTADGASSDIQIVLSVEGRDADISYTVSSGRAVSFRLEDFDAYLLKLYGSSLKSVSFNTPAARYGTLYYNYTDKNIFERAVDSSDVYYRSTPSVSKVSFVADETYYGGFSITCNGVDSANNTFRASVLINVVDESGGLGGAGDINYRVAPGKTVYFSEDDFDDLCDRLTDRSLDYIRFTSLPSSSRGVLYHDGSRVSEGTRYYLDGSSSTRLIEDLYFRAASGYSGTVDLPFTGYNTRGGTFSGTVEISVSSSGGGDVSYRTNLKTRVSFLAADFSDACDAATGSTLNYIRFNSLPSSTYGTLYHNTDGRVSTGTNYYRTGSGNLIGNLSFVPANSYSGSFSIPYTGYTTGGKTYSGYVYINVSSRSSSDVSYEGKTGQRLQFAASDFSDACYAARGAQLNYIRFSSLPSSAYGTLYYGGSTRAETTTSYYRTGSGRLIDSLSIMPNSTYSGTFSFPYTGYDVNGRSYSGNVTITVERPAQTGITYVTGGTAVNFDYDDFARATTSALRGTLASVRFYAPGASCGTLYQNYVSPANKAAFVPNRGYDLTTSRVSFLPKAGFQGTVHVTYTASDILGNSYNGTVSILVSPSGNSTRFTDMGGAAWAAPSVDFLREYGIVKGGGGRRFMPSSPMRRGDFVLMLSRAYGFADAGTTSFSDVPANQYYASAIASAKSLGLVKGSKGQFRPDATITRQEAATMLYRLLQAREGLAAGTQSNLTRFTDQAQVSPYAVAAMGAMVRDGILEGSAKQLKPRAALTRAEMAVILHRALT